MEENKSNVYLKLFKIQQDLKVPKNQFNAFGKYKYRSCEDILETAKPILNSVNCIVVLTDKIVQHDNRYYVEATATLIDCDNVTEKITTTAYAREDLLKKGMDESQITGSASSYARKYALNGLFCIDDTKDSDSTNDGNKKDNTNTTTNQYVPLIKFDTKNEKIRAISKIKTLGKPKLERILKTYNRETVEQMTDTELIDCVNKLKIHIVKGD